MTIADLPAAWRAEAEAYERDGALVRGDHILRRAAEQLEQALRAAAGELLNLRQAARESGYSEDQLSRLVRQGKIPNAGKKHAPKVRRGDLPRKPSRVAASPGSSKFVELVRDAVDSKVER